MLIMFIAKVNVSENLSTYFIFQPTRSKAIEDFFLRTCIYHQVLGFILASIIGLLFDVIFELFIIILLFIPLRVYGRGIGNKMYAWYVTSNSGNPISRIIIKE